MWPLTDENKKRHGASDRRIGAVAGGYSMARIKKLGTFNAPTRDAAMIHVNAILDRGHMAAMKNIANQFVITESVMA